MTFEGDEITFEFDEIKLRFDEIELGLALRLMQSAAWRMQSPVDSTESNSASWLFE